MSSDQFTLLGAAYDVAGYKTAVSEANILMYLI